ncbi:MAG TPA: hypothetical protein VMD59_15590 [Acidimicrobiales bacterium]|nr:hypothetical protein [Acidimicrobiales bacterium]
MRGSVAGKAPTGKMVVPAGEQLRDRGVPGKPLQLEHRCEG